MHPLVELWLKQDESILPTLLNIASQLYRENGLQEIIYKGFTFDKQTKIFSDEVYDQLKEKCNYEEPKMNASDRPKIKQLLQFGTLEKITKDSFLTYKNRVKDIQSFIVFPKYDGIGLRIYYGTTFLTRYDKVYGLDVSYKCQNLLPDYDFSKVIMRGELMTLKDHKNYSSRRSYVSAHVANMNPLPDDIIFICYEYLQLNDKGEVIPNTTQWMLEQIKQVFKFQHTTKIVSHEDLSYQSLKEFHETIPEQYKVDGVVVRPDSSKYSYENLEKPRWQVGVKFEQQLYQSSIDRITWSVGQLGFLSPTLWLKDPITIDGSVIQKASGVNFNFLFDQNLRPNSQCIVSLKVVPRIIGQALQDSTAEKFSQIIKPKCCPQCGGEIEELNHSVDRYKCKDYLSGCFKKVLMNRAKKVLKIKGLGEERIKKIAQCKEIRFDVWLNQYEYTDLQLFEILSENLGEKKAIEQFDQKKLSQLKKLYGIETKITESENESESESDD